MNMGFLEATGLAPLLVSGLTDVDAITLSTLRLYDLGKLQPVQAVIAIVLALVSNILFKLGLVFAAGGAALARRPCSRLPPLPAWPSLFFPLKLRP